MIDFRPYQPRYQPDFKALNLEWLDALDLTESHDLKILDDPSETILNGGGMLLLAFDGEKVVGSSGLRKDNQDTYELVKMAVAPAYRGKGIGKQLLEACLEWARAQKAEKIFLYSNTQLLAALQLYTRYGFRHIESFDAPLETADVKMELILNK